MHLTFWNKTPQPNGYFLIWSSDKSFRRFFFHGFRGVNDKRYHYCVHFLGFVAAGSFR